MRETEKRRVLPRRLNSILYLMLMVLFVNLIPMCLLSQGMYRRARETVEGTVVASKLDWQQWLMENVNQQLNALWQAQFAATVSRSAYIVRLTGTGAYSEAEFRNAKLDIQKQLNTFSAGRDYIDSARVYFLDQNIAISNGSVSYRIDGEILAQLKALYETKGDMLAFSGGKIYLISNVTQGGAGAQKRLPAVICLSVISPDKLFTAINDKADVTNRNLMLIRNDTGEALYSSVPGFADARIGAYVTDGANGDGAYQTMTFGGREQMVFYYRCAPVNMTLVELVDATALFAGLGALQTLYSRLLILLIILNAVIISTMYFMFYTPARQLVKGFARSAAGELGLQLKTRHLADEFRDIFEGFNRMSLGIKQMVDRDYAQRILMQTAELKQLQLQINPHFLYNSFFILRSMLLNEDYDTATQMCRMMGDYLKYITKTDETDATLTREFEHARAYAGIQLIRFARSVKVDICAVPPDISDMRVPKLILQPLLENAFLHGMKDVIEGGVIRVSIRRENGTLRILVEDNGRGMTDEGISEINRAVGGAGPGGSGIALNNIHNRVRIRYGEESGLRVSRSELGGLCMTLTMVCRDADAAETPGENRG